MRLAAAGALWGRIQAHGLRPDTVILADDGGRFASDRHALGRVPAARLGHRLTSIRSTTTEGDGHRPEVPRPTNGAARDLRPRVVKRKLSGGTRSDRGRAGRDACLGPLQTCAKLGVACRDHLGPRLGVLGADAPYLPDLVSLRSVPARAPGPSPLVVLICPSSIDRPSDGATVDRNAPTATTEMSDGRPAPEAQAHRRHPRRAARRPRGPPAPQTARRDQRTDRRRRGRAAREHYTKRGPRYVQDAATGERVKREVPLRFRRWWWLGPDGKVILDVRYGARRLEIKPKKATVEVGAKDNLVPTLQVLKEAVAAGELDTVLLAAREERVGRFRRSGP